MRQFLLALVLILGTSVTSFGCDFGLYVSESTLSSAWFEPPPRGYGISYPWTPQQTSAAVGVMSWPSSFNASVEIGQKYVVTGSATYFLVAFSPSRCGYDLGMYGTQGQLIGTYQSGALTYKLYALKAKDGSYNTLIDLTNRPGIYPITR